jgi:hypothetical protein
MDPYIIQIQDHDSYSSDSIETHHTNNDHIYENRLNVELQQIREAANSFVPTRPIAFNDYSNSPLTLSGNNSDDEGGSADAHFRQLTLSEVEQSIDKHYDDIDNKYSSELDILITYMKGQKNLYLQSHLLSQYKLNMLMIPALLVSACVTIFAPLIQHYSWSGGVVSGLNAFIAMLISLVNYYKLESSTQTFYNTALQYDKLETSLEFVSSKTIFIDDVSNLSKVVFEKVNEIEQKISEIKDWNPLFIPNEVRQMFPVISHVNIFSFIKRIETNKKMLLAKYKDIKNEIRHILYRFSKKHENQQTTDRLEKRLQYLVETKDRIKDELGHCRNAYSHIDEIFTIEIKNAEKKKKWFHCLRETCTDYDGLAKYNHTNPVVDKYMHHIFS